MSFPIDYTTLPSAGAVCALTMIAGGFLSQKAAKRMGFAPDNCQQAWGIGATLASSIMTSVIDSSPLAVMIKIVAIAGSCSAGAYLGKQLIENRLNARFPHIPHTGTYKIFSVGGKHLGGIIGTLSGGYCLTRWGPVVALIPAYSLSWFSGAYWAYKGAEVIDRLDQRQANSSQR